MEEVGEGADVDEFEQNKEKLKINSVIVSNYANSKIGIARETKARFCCGYLLGKFEEALVKVYDLIELDLSLFENVDVSLPLSDSIVTELALIRASVPVGIDFVGFFVTQPENGNIEVAEHLLSILKTLEDLKYVDIYLVCLIKPSMSLWHATYDEEQLECIGDVVEEELDISNQPIFRLRQDYVINWLVHTGAEGFQIENEKVQDELLCNKSAFLINEIGVVLYESGEGNSLPNWNCKELTNELKKVLELKRWPSDSPNGNIVDVTSLTKITQSISERNMEEDIYENKCFAPVLLSQKISGECITIKVSLDVLVTASMDVSTKKLLYMFRDGIYRQQSALGLLIKKNQCNFTYEPLHFCPANSKIPITVLLPFSDFEGIRLNEDSYKTYRTSLHQRFLLPDDRPLFKKCLSIFDGRSTYHLVNPHEGLSSPKIDGGVVALVNGKYSYHHYMQDNFDDNIWGCAYRSLQTLASWFWFQGYTDKTYPSHKEIQEALVAIGDKEKSFVGSNEWIGSMEVSYCLDHLFGVTSKTLHVSTGADMAYKGRELYQHFKDHGTPIMIGGGVLAHTIVGVVYNEQTGDIRYLIVDPHFTGHEQLKTVLSKGWVGWKGPEFWNQNAHYNLCMPQRPKEI